MNAESDIMTVADVAAEMKWSDEKAYEELRRLGVRGWGRGREGFRFRRREYEEARDRAAEPIPPRKPYTRQATATAAPPAPAKPKPRVSKLREAR